MNKLAIIDLDGVIADNTARFAKAEEAKRNAMPDKLEDALTLSVAQEKELTNLYWQTAFTPELVSLDTLIEGVREAINELEDNGYNIYFLTSRPEHMREATLDWLHRHKVYIKKPGAWDKLIMKAPAFQYTKTTVWKAGMVQTLASWYGASEVLVIDDEEANRVEIAKYERNYELAFACSMADAITVINMP